MKATIVESVIPLECKGCNIHDYSCIVRPSFTHNDHIFSCPCQTCIVKGMCTEYCDNLQQYMIAYYDYVKGNLTEYHKYIKRVKTGSNPMFRYNTKYMRGLSAIVKYKDAREISKLGNEHGTDLLDSGRY